MKYLCLFFVVCFLSLSCTTKKEIVYESHTDTIYNETHDTIHIFKCDTIKETQYITHVDTIKDVQIRTITLKESGDTIREVVNNNMYHYVYAKDSTDRYKSKVDSLQKAINELQKEKVNVVENKKVTKKVKGIWSIIAPVFLFLFILAIMYWSVRKLKQ